MVAVVLLQPTEASIAAQTDTVSNLGMERNLGVMITVGVGVN